ncbi:mitochondrial carrier domain-containing protein [Entophlyctis helioformis]|nr:mitochondrial carrier domain-containing protein [Entophlyctis helioformis]
MRSPKVAMLALLASCVASAVTRILTHPIDTVKSRLQVGVNVGPATDVEGQQQQQQQQQSLLPAFRHIIQTEGFMALMQGLPVTLLFSLPGLSVYLGVYDGASLWFARSLQLPIGGLIVSTLAATIAEMLSALFWTPMEIIKTRQQVAVALPGAPRHSHLDATSLGEHSPILSASNSSINSTNSHAECAESAGDEEPRKPTAFASRSALQHAQWIYANEGISGFFQGYWLGLAVFVPYSIVYFVVYEQLKAASATQFHHGVQEQLSTWDYTACSAVSAAVAALVSNVFDVVKTRWQARSHAVTPAESAGAAGGSVLVMLKETGMGTVFLAGAWARVAWAVPSAVLSFTIYEQLKLA